MKEEIDEIDTQRPDNPLRQHFDQLRMNIMSNDPEKQFMSTRILRELLSVDENSAIIHQVIESGVVPYIVQMLQQQETSATPLLLQLEAIGVLGGITAGTIDHLRYIIHLGGVPIFVDHLMSSNEDIREQAVWALGIIAGEDLEGQELVLSAGALTGLVHICAHEQSRPSIVRLATWTLCNLLPSINSPHLELTILPLLAQRLGSQDIDTVDDACRGLSQICDIYVSGVQLVLDTGIVAPRLIDLLGNNSPAIKVAALELVGHILTGTDAQIDLLIQSNHNPLPILLQLLDCEQRNIRKVACSILSNLTLRATKHIQAMIDAEIFPRLLEFLMTSLDVDLRNFATKAVSNVVSKGNPDQIWYMIQIGTIPVFCSFLLVKDDKELLILALEGLENILQVGKITNQLHDLTKIVFDCGGDRRILYLQANEDAEVSRLASVLLETIKLDEKENDVI